MDESVILAKVESLQHCLERIRSRMPSSVENLTADYDLQDIDWAIVFSIVTTRLSDFSDFVRHVSAKLNL